MNSFTIYKEYYELITLLTEKEQQELLLAIVKYMFEDKIPKLNEKQTKIFNNLKRPLDASKKQSKIRTKEKPEKNQKETKEKPEKNQKETHQDVNVIVNVNGNVNNNKIINYLESNGFILYPIDYEIIAKWKDDELTRYAIKQAVLNQRFSTKYVDRILTSYKSKGIISVAQAMKDDEDFRKSKEKRNTNFSKTSREILEEYRQKEKEKEGKK